MNIWMLNLLARKETARLWKVKSPYKRSWQQCVAQQYKRNASLRSHGNSGYVNASHLRCLSCYELCLNLSTRMTLVYGESASLMDVALSVLKWFDVCSAVTRLNMYFLFHFHKFFRFTHYSTYTTLWKVLLLHSSVKIDTEGKRSFRQRHLCACHKGVWGLLTSALRWRWSVNFTNYPLHLSERARDTHWIGCLVGPQSRPRLEEGKNILLLWGGGGMGESGYDFSVAQSLANILTALSRLQN